MILSLFKSLLLSHCFNNFSRVLDDVKIMLSVFLFFTILVVVFFEMKKILNRNIILRNST